MAGESLPFLRGRIDRVEPFQSVFGGAAEPPPLPPRDPAKHRAYLTEQLERIAEQVEARPEGTRVEGATRELIAVSAERELVAPESLADRKSDTRLVSVDDDTGVAIIDAPDPRLEHLRRKIDRFADDTKVSRKTGQRANAKAIAPIASIRLAQLEDVAGSRIREAPPAESALRWFEVACRGGYREREFSAETQAEMRRALAKLHVRNVQEYEATERLVFFIRCSLATVENLLGMVDCVYEVDLAGPEVRPFLMYEADLREEIRGAIVTAPPEDAPSVALLDSGIASQHPLLDQILAGAVSVVPGFEGSPEDTEGHGTEMAGIAAYWDVADVIDSGGAVGTHWLESARVWIGDGIGTAKEEFRPYWPKMTVDAVGALEALGDRRRIFATAVASPNDRPGRPTYWSHAVDRLAYNDGAGRLFLLCAGNARSDSVALLEGYPTLNLEENIWDPSQAVNAITVGAFTARTTIPPGKEFASYAPIAPSEGISPHTSAGPIGDGDATKPDVVFEGGNVGFDGKLPNPTLPTLTALTTGHRHRYGRPLSLLWATSEATARAAWFAAELWRRHPDLTPQTVRGLIVHSASWTERMVAQFPNIKERLAICGFGVPDLEFASTCARQRATVILEDEMPNASPLYVVERGKRREKLTRVLKAFRMPLPDDVLLAGGDEDVELRVTLSYFAEPNTFKRHLQRGLDLRWDMQGLQESEEEFLKRINRLARGQREREDKTKPIRWQLGIRGRSRGTVQSDRWKGPASLLAGNKLIAVYPTLGWWDHRDELKTSSMGFSLIVTVRGAAVEIYETIAAELEAVIPVTI